MLTADLVRASVHRGRVRPRWIDPASPELRAEAATLIELFDRHRGRPVGELHEAIADHIGDATDFQIRRGLVKLLEDRADIEVVAPRPPETIRQVAFEEAARAWPVAPTASDADAGGGAIPAGTGTFTDRAEVLGRAAARLELSSEEVEEALFADRKREERLVDVALPEPETLLHRYNLALAQAVLLRAREVVVELDDPEPARARRLLQLVKFHRLMHRGERTEAGWRIVLDGPLSLFRQTQRYGLQLALFLPALLHARSWRLSAEVVWGRQRRPCRFELDPSVGLRPPRRERGTWESREERQLRAAWAELDTSWRLERATELIDLDGRDVLVPDYVLVHPDGRRALLELVWFWRRRTFERKMTLLREAGPPNLIVALAQRMNTDGEPVPELPGAVHAFKGVIRPKELLRLAEAVGRYPEELAPRGGVS